MKKERFNYRWMIILAVMLSAMLGVHSLPVIALEEISPDEVIRRSNESITLLNLSKDKTVTAQIHIRTENRNDTREREIVYCRKDCGEKTKAVFTVLVPAEEKGSGLLTWNDDDTNKEDQWLYVSTSSDSSARRVFPKDSFMDTDLTYSDLGDWDMADYEYRHLEPEVIDGIECYHVELKSYNDEVIKKTGYKRIEVWVRPDIWMFVKIRFYDEGDTPLKELTIAKIEPIKSSDESNEIYWTPTKLQMQNLRENKRTTITFSDVAYNVDLDPGKFSKRQLTKEEPCFRKKEGR
jgi:outer membrane lipoprotein-sorting protein